MLTVCLRAPHGLPPGNLTMRGAATCRRSPAVYQRVQGSMRGTRELFYRVPSFPIFKRAMFLSSGLVILRGQLACFEVVPLLRNWEVRSATRPSSHAR